MLLNTIGSSQPVRTTHTFDQTGVATQPNVKIDSVQNSAHKITSTQSPKNDATPLTTKLWDKVFHQDIASFLLQKLDFASLENFQHAGKIYPELFNFTTNSYFEKALDLLANYPLALSNHQKYVMMHLVGFPALVDLKKNGSKNITTQQIAALEYIWPGGKDSLQEIARNFECRHIFSKYFESGKNKYYSRIDNFKNSFIDLKPNNLTSENSIFNDANKYNHPLFSQAINIQLDAGIKDYLDFFNQAESIIHNGSASEKLMVIYVAKHLISAMRDNVNYFPNLNPIEIDTILKDDSYPFLSGLISYFPEGSKIFSESKSNNYMFETRNFPSEIHPS